jgi:hypothetical protein
MHIRTSFLTSPHLWLRGTRNLHCWQLHQHHPHRFGFGFCSSPGSGSGTSFANSSWQSVGVGTPAQRHFYTAVDVLGSQCFQTHVNLMA